MKLILIFLITFFNMSVYANNIQEATLQSSLYKKNQSIEFYDFYTYLETNPLVFEGQNAFEALTFRGEGIKIILSVEDSSIKARIEGKEILLGRLDNTVDTLYDGFNTITIKSAVQIRLDHASLGQSYKIKVPVCLPGLPCNGKTIKVTPHRYKYTVVGADGEAFCIQRGFNQNASNDLKVNDTYSLGECR